MNNYPTELSWVSLYVWEVVAPDFVETYRDHDIYLSAPNGGIIGVSVVTGDYAWGASTEQFALYHDDDWHIAQAKQWIDDLAFL